MPAIEVKNVSFTKNNNEILQRFSCTFEKGRITALIGPSGAGKTSLLKLLNGLHSPSSGEITIDGQSIQSINLVELRKKVGMALQSAPMIKGTVYDNLNLPKALFNDSLEEHAAYELLAQVKLNIKLDQPAKELSGGQKQRLSIARTLVNRPQVLLLDEITSSLDPASVKEVEKLILSIHEMYQTTIIWITHDVGQAIKVTDDFVMMEEGTFITGGSSKNMMKSNHPRLTQFLAGEIE
ncbi:ABC transporter ATP-binding protein [Macrococcus lamae]|uniref:Phosphate ABC transporter ATP-binding protein n=1 Tax=Macrococcus lamae TaxID=198484 RepID=A0A4R6BX21_9STAP|nr:phosphate ABC transporter ATP-binding protein [Macrococcus lamae]TDM12556.1 phosphate ABC transporter ATP-binding protein [Macrococcus lamae]